MFHQLNDQRKKNERMKWEKTAIAVLAVLLCVSMLAGCGSVGSKPAAGGTVPDGSKDAEAQETHAPAESEEVTAPVTQSAGPRYEAQYVALSDQALTAGLENGCIVGDSLYFTSLGVIDDHTPDGVTPEWPEQYWVYGPVLCKVGFDGTTERVPYVPMSSGTEENGNSGTIYEALCAGRDGTMWLAQRHYRSWNEAPEGMAETDPEYAGYTRSEEIHELVHLHADGTVAGTFPLDELQVHKAQVQSTSDSYSFEIRGMAVDGDGHVCLAVFEWLSGTGRYASDGRVCVLDGDTGALLTAIQLTSTPEYVAALPDGRVAVCRYENGECIGLVNVETGSLEDVANIDDFLNGMTTGSGDYDLCYSAGDSLYGLNVDNGESEKLFNWIDCDVARQGGESVCVLEDGRIITSSGKQTAKGMDNQLVIVAAANGQTKEKTVLRLAVMNLYPFTSEMVSRFNRSNPDYRIEVTDYSQYNDYSSQNEEDWYAGISRLQTEIIAGNVPDILDISLLSADRLGSKGLLEDLYPYIDADPEFGREDLMEHVIATFEDEGKLYQTVGNFYVLTTAGLTNVVGDKMGWTMDEFNTAMQNLQAENPNCTVFDSYTTRDDALNFLLYLEMENFVDWTTGSCSFDSENFIQLLQFIRSFPTAFDWANADVSAENFDQDTRLRMGLQLMKQCNFSCFEDLQGNTVGLGGAPCTFVGYPTESGVGSMFAQIGNSFAISSGCADKQAAWQFVRQFFLPVYQEQFIGSVFPTNREVYEQMKYEAMTAQYERNPDGSYMLNAEGKRIEASRGSVTVNGVVFPYKTVTEAEIAQVEDIINATTNVLHTDNSLKSIIAEGAAPFFADQRSVEEVARLIQSKAMIYVNEQR